MIAESGGQKLSKKIALIGAGAMGGAILRGLVNNKNLTIENPIQVIDRNPGKLADLKDHELLRITNDVHNLTDCDIAILAVKPYHVHQVIQDIPNGKVGCFASVAAGIPLKILAEWGNVPVARIIPNTPCLINKGISAIAYTDNTPSRIRQTIELVFGSVGEVYVLPETTFDTVTALSGCGPAYVYLMIEALIDAGCAQGLTRDIARQFVASTFVGAAQMVKDSKEHPGQLKDKVTSPGGVTIQALHILEKAGVRGVLWDAVNRAMERSKEMESEYSGGRG